MTIVKATAPENIDDYIEGFSGNVQKILQKIRKTIQKAAPNAQEAISYHIPTFRLNGNLIHFAAYQHHIGLYPGPRGVKEFEKEMARYEGGKGTVRFPLDEPVPYELITRIVRYRVDKSVAAAAAKGKKGAASSTKGTAPVNKRASSAKKR
jgi:uncharacterized protein YdhG (YjbR/CyaY superfamily)